MIWTTGHLIYGPTDQHYHGHGWAARYGRVRHLRPGPVEGVLLVRALIGSDASPPCAEHLRLSASWHLTSERSEEVTELRRPNSEENAETLSNEAEQRTGVNCDTTSENGQEGRKLRKRKEPRRTHALQQSEASQVLQASLVCIYMLHPASARAYA